jgi:hypothetical protein
MTSTIVGGRMKLVALLVLGILSNSCSKKKEEEETAEAQRVNSLAVPVSPAAAFTKVSTTMSSLAEIKSPKGNTMNPSSLAVPLAEVSDHCKTSGTPKESTYTSGTGKEAAMYGYCNFAMHPDGPDTVLGAIDRVKGMLCAFGDLTYDGVERTVKFKFTTDCFSKTFVDMVAEQLGADREFSATLTASEPVKSDFGSTEYSKSITFDVPEVSFSYDILYTQNGSVLSAAIKDGTGVDADGSYFAINLDRGATATSEGALRVDGRFTVKDDTSNSSPPASRHVRAYATGMYDLVTSSMTTLSKVEFITADLRSTGNASLRSIKGTPTDGVYAIKVDVSTAADTDYAAYTPTSEATYCFGDGDCTGNTGINVSSADDLKFLTSCKLGSSSYKSATEMFKTTAPLSFTSIKLSE